jgi:hypothetical protein
VYPIVLIGVVIFKMQYFSFLRFFVPLLLFLRQGNASDFFHEKLRVTTLDDLKVLFQFEFEIRRSIQFSVLHGYQSNNGFHLFPRSFGQTLELYGVKNLNISMTKGVWNWEQWGYPDPNLNSPTGSSISVEFHPVGRVYEEVR